MDITVTGYFVLKNEGLCRQRKQLSAEAILVPCGMSTTDLAVTTQRRQPMKNYTFKLWKVVASLERDTKCNIKPPAIVLPVIPFRVPRSRDMDSRCLAVAMEPKLQVQRTSCLENAPSCSYNVADSEAKRRPLSL